MFAAGASTSEETTLTEGRAGAELQIVIYEDLQCPDCAAFQVMMDRQILPKYGDRVEFVHKDFPLVRHKWARQAAIASRFFRGRSKGLALAYRRETMMHQAQISEGNFRDFLRRFAVGHEIVAEEAVAALDDPRYEAMVQADCHEGVLKGIMHTPTVVAGETRLVERFTFAQLSAAIDGALEKRK